MRRNSFRTELLTFAISKDSLSRQTSPSLSETGDEFSADSVLLQVFPPFLVAGLGMVAAGLLLGVVHKWPVFVEVREILILVPALLGLKGNLEMTLASRIATAANLGDLDDYREKLFWSIIWGNLMVVECQAIIVGFLSAFVAIVMDFLATGTPCGSYHALVMTTSGVSAASIAAIVLATVMIGVVLLARRCGIDPDNVASPIAGMLGDFCTLALLSGFASLMWSQCGESEMLLLIAVYVAMTPFFAWQAYVNPHVTKVLREGWTPVIASMLISSCGGLILKHGVHNFVNLAPFAPVMNGAGGNLAAVHASRLSTSLHMCASPKWGSKTSWLEAEDVPSSVMERLCPALVGNKEEAQTARRLACCILPGACVFASIIVGVRSGWQAIPDPFFLLCFVVAGIFQVCILLIVAHTLVGALWKRGINPDNAAIPYVTALGDVVGTSCLVAAFFVLHVFGSSVWSGSKPA